VCHSAGNDRIADVGHGLRLTGHAIYLTEFFGPRADFGLLSSLALELEAHAGEGMINWSQHFKHENPDFSPTFQRVVANISDYFELDVYATRLNFYPVCSSTPFADVLNGRNRVLASAYPPALAL
jgi:hypothetical protein